MYVDGSLMLKRAGGRVLLISTNGDKLRYALQLHFQATNNVTEYEALLHIIWAAVMLGVHHVVWGDSELVINQVMKESIYRNMCMEAYYAEVHKLEGKFNGIELHHVLRRDNEEADALAMLVSSRKHLPLVVFLNVLETPLAHLEREPETSPEGPPPTQARPAADHYLMKIA